MANINILVPSARRTKGYTVRFQWNANPEPAVTGYRLYATRESGDYATSPPEADDSPVDMGNNTTGSYQIRRPNGLGWWYFNLTAYTAEAESPLSTEASINITPEL